MDAAVTHLLRTTLAKSSKEQAVPPSSSLEMPTECQKLKKHIALLCDRICKGWMPSGQKIEVRLFPCQEAHSLINLLMAFSMPYYMYLRSSLSHIHVVYM